MIKKFYKGRQYRHTCSTDLDILVLSIVAINSKRIKLKIKFVNKRSGMIQYNGRRDNSEYIEIQTKDLDAWSVVENI